MPTDIFHLDVGAGPPCLVMHGGLGVDHSQFREGLDPLGDVLRLVYYDHRGNGRSGRPPIETLTLGQLADDADALRSHLGYEKVAVLGHSFGGCIAESGPPSWSSSSGAGIILSWRSRTVFGP